MKPAVKRSLWLLAGVAAGLLAGFAIGLGRPRERHVGFSSGTPPTGGE